MTSPPAPGTPPPGPAAAAGGGFALRHVVVVVVVLGMTALVGAALSLLAPHGSLFAGDRARRALVSDTAAGLTRAAAIADAGDANLAGVGALAHLLLWRDRGASDDERAAGERLLQSASPAVRGSPEALYARALLSVLQPLDRPVIDDTLDEDLKRAPDGDAWVHLARALRVDDPERRRELERAAFACGTHPHATWMLARWLLATDDLDGARAALDRLLLQAPGHAGAVLTAVVAAARAEATSTRKRAAGGAARGPVPLQSRTEEIRANGLLDRDLAPLDEDLVVFAIWFAQVARGTGVDAALRPRVVALAGRSDRNAERAIEISLLDSDVDTAISLVDVVPAASARSSLLADAARVRFWKAVPEAERLALLRSVSLPDDKGRGGRGLDDDGLRLPLGRLDRPSLTAWASGLPWVARASPAVFPERLLATVEASPPTTKREALVERLVVVQSLALAERALARGDVAGGLALAEQARAKAPTDVDVALVHAAVRARQDDRAAVKAELDAIIVDEAAPTTLLTAARIALEVDDLATCRKAMNAFARTGLQAPLAAALLANLEARGGELAAARAALVEARRLGAGDDVHALRAVVLVERAGEPAEARKAADALLRRGPGGGDVVGAWLAEAQFRAGEQPRAEAALRAIVSAQPLLGEAHLFLAQAIAFNPAQAQEAFERAMRAMDLIERGPLLDEAKALALSLKKR